ncbi:glycoside hydrolase family 65 [Paenibacillus sp. y28]|uniref:glycoside hydrolase family 65 n=1 Tax=Paenibacillus sp. y28 TaxID=3129110 RepID=UPI003018922D
MQQTPIDRKALVHRHHPVLRQADPLSPLSVGNGQFAFTADLTGLQSYPEQYTVPLGTQAQWGWHSTGGLERYRLEDITPQQYPANGRSVGYYVNPVEGEEAKYHWLRQNPHRLQLARIGLRLLGSDGGEIPFGALQQTEQTLDLWQGILTSRFVADGQPVTVLTCCHPDADMLGIRIASPLLEQGRLQVTLSFPSSDPASTEWAKCTGPLLETDTVYTAELALLSGQQAVITRTLDQDSYTVYAQWSSGTMIQTGPRRFQITAAEDKQETAVLECLFGFHDRSDSGKIVWPAQNCSSLLDASRAYWEKFWMSGGAIDLSGSTDPRAPELERRLVLSQFLTAVHCSGTLPPQETGLLYNSWFGKFHLEMHWWHAVHFALWGRTQLLERSLPWYKEILPAARQLARSQGYSGARWPKMVGPDGRDSPSPIGPLLIWQQPHPLVYAELCYLAAPTVATLETYREIVMETAEFMASFAAWDDQAGRYVLGPSLIPAQEQFDPKTTWNPTFELEYWRHGLEIAQTWRTRLGLERNPDWQHVLEHLSALPVYEGVYTAHENSPDTFEATNTDHPSMLGALGILPGKLADPAIMRATLKRVMQEWEWDTAWGWDFPMTAMTAARLGERQFAVDALLKAAVKNTYLANGHNYQRKGLTAYLPGNGGLLAAAALMACGWQGGTDAHAPGFPDDGTWTVRWEGLNAWL